MNHIYFMKKALTLAEGGKGQTSPNPMVGAVLVKGGSIIGRGYHRKHGSLHAEIEALNDAWRRVPDADLSKDTILYVTLEPCCHRGNGKINPPCCERIISEKIPEVVIASVDPNPAVSGKGIRMLEEAGIKVSAGILDKEEKKLNRVYHHCTEKAEPFIHLKMAQTLDSFIAGEEGSSKWISNMESRIAVHKMRSEYDSVLIGSGTALSDNPELTVRHVEGRQPFRLVLDTGLRIPEESRLLTDAFSDRTHIFYNPETASEKQIKKHSGRKYSIHPVEINRSGKLSLDNVMGKAWELGIRSVLAEGGSILASELLRAGKVSRISLFISPQLFFRGIPSFIPESSEGPSGPVAVKEPEIEILNDNIHISGEPYFI